MTCRGCQKESSVKKTITDGVVVRVRECSRCRLRWITDERVRRGSVMAISSPLVAIPGQAPSSSDQKSSTSTNEEKKGKKPVTATNSRETAVEANAASAMIAVFCEEYPITYSGVKYCVSPKDSGQAKQLAKAGFGGDWRATVKRYLASRDAFFVNAKHPLALLVGSVNQFASDAKVNGAARDIRVGWAGAEVKQRASGPVEDF